MLGKTLKHGTGSCARAIDYLLSEIDHAGEPHTVTVLRGDPRTVAAVADSLEFKWRYSSSVISFAPEDNPTAAEIDDALRDWEALAFAGMDRSRFSYTAVQHTAEDGRIDIHIVVARVDLETGKSFNPCPPGHEHSFKHWRDMHNYKHGWSRPDDPARARMVQPVISTHGATAKTQITEYLTELAAVGLITNAADVRAAVAELGTITRTGDNYISVMPEGATRAVRLKGALYASDWTTEQQLRREAAGKATRAVGRGGRIDTDRAAAAEQRYTAAVSRRAGINLEKYRAAARGVRMRAAVDAEAVPERSAASAISNDQRSGSGANQATVAGPDQPVAQRSAEADASRAEQSAGRSASPEPDNGGELAKALAYWRRGADRYINSSGDGHKNGGHSNSAAGSGVAAIKQPDSRSADDLGADAAANVGRGPEGGGRAAVHSAAAGQKSGRAVDAGKPGGGVDNGVNDHDRSGTNVEPATATVAGDQSGGNSGVAAVAAATAAAVRSFTEQCQRYTGAVREYVQRYTAAVSISGGESERGERDSERGADVRDTLQQQHSASANELATAVEQLKYRGGETSTHAYKITKGAEARAVAQQVREYQRQQQQAERGGWELEL